MSDPIYAACGVTRPRNTADTFIALASEYAGLARTASDAGQSFANITSHLASENRGRTTDAMLARMSGLGSSPHQLNLISEAAAQTSDGYAAAGQALDAGVLAMDAVTVAAASAILLAIPSPHRTQLIQVILRSAQTNLKVREAQTVEEIHAALSAVSPPAPIDVAAQRPNESLSPEVSKYWKSLTPQQRRKAIEAIVAERARQHGIDPPPPIKYFDKNSEEGKKNWAGYWDGTTLHINSDHLGEPIAMNIAVHEMGHAIQTSAEKEYANYSATDIANMKSGARPDAFSKYGLTAAEVERMQAAKQHYSNSGWSYGRAPIELDAGRNAYEWSDQLTVEKLRGYVG